LHTLVKPYRILTVFAETEFKTLSLRTTERCHLIIKVCQVNDNENRNKFPSFVNDKYNILQPGINVQNFVVVFVVVLPPFLLLVIPICPFSYRVSSARSGKLSCPSPH
jgi:hypothetical protein